MHTFSASTAVTMSPPKSPMCPERAWGSCKSMDMHSDPGFGPISFADAVAQLCFAHENEVCRARGGLQPEVPPSAGQSCVLVVPRDEGLAVALGAAAGLGRGGGGCSPRGLGSISSHTSQARLPSSAPPDPGRSMLDVPTSQSQSPTQTLTQSMSPSQTARFSPRDYRAEGGSRRSGNRWLSPYNSESSLPPQSADPSIPNFEGIFWHEEGEEQPEQRRKPRGLIRQRWAEFSRMLLENANRKKAGPKYPLLPHWLLAQQKPQAFMKGAAAYAQMGFIPGISNSYMSQSKLGDLMEANSFLQPYIFKPNSVTRLVWAAIGLVFLLWDGITVPLAVFDFGELYTAFQLISFLVICYWALDIPMQFLSGFVTQDGIIEMRPRAIRRHYLSTRFGLDLLVVSLDAVVFFVIDGADLFGIGVDGVERDVDDDPAAAAGVNAGLLSVRLTRLMRLLRLVRLMRAQRLKDWFNEVTERLGSQQVLLAANLAKYVFSVMLINHYIACAFYTIAFVTPEPEQTWIRLYSDDFVPGWHLYTMALHWSLTQFSPSTNNIAPVTIQERVLACFTALIAMLVFTSLISGATSAVNQIRLANVEMLKEETAIRQFMVQRGVSTSLFARVQSFLKNSYRKKAKRVSEGDIAFFGQLPESLLIEMHLEIYFPKLLLYPVFATFNDIDKAFFTKLCHIAMTDSCYLAGQDIFMDGTGAGGMLVFVSGSGSYTITRMVEHARRGSDVVRHGSLDTANTANTGITLAMTEVSESSASWDGDFLPETEEQLRKTIHSGLWMSEMAMWVLWVHAGRLQSDNASDVFHLNTAKVGSLLKSHGHRELFSSLRTMAILVSSYAHSTEEHGGATISDLPLDLQEILEMVNRACKFAKFHHLGMLVPDQGHEDSDASDNRPMQMGSSVATFANFFKHHD